MNGERVLAEPEISPETEAFWAAATEGRLVIGRCGACGEAFYYPRALCPCCLSANVELETVSGHGRIYSYSVMRAAPVPYAIAFVSLDEGPAVMTNIVDADFDGLTIGQPVQLAFRRSEIGQMIPVFQPVSNT